MVESKESLRKYGLCFTIEGIIYGKRPKMLTTPERPALTTFWNRKEKENKEQDFPVFAYLVNSIGETLDATRREESGKSDLEVAKNLFNAYRGSPKTFPAKK